MNKIVSIFFLLFLIFFTSSQKTFAEENFSTDYNVSYSVNNDATTHVVLNGTLTNLTDKYYASSYSVDVGFSDIQNIRSSDTTGDISPKISKSSSGTSITLDFNNSAPGLKKKYKFNVSFDTNEVAQNYNNTWDINIPGISSKNDFSSFNVTVTYPYFLGKPSFTKPNLTQSASQSANTLFFTKSDLGTSGISIAFGSFQVYDFNLKYHLENTGLFSAITEIALPSTTNYQDVEINNINPKPIDVYIDRDGNWLAKYLLSPSKKLTVEVNGKTKVYINPKEEFLNKNLIKEYLEPQKYWEADNEKIKTLAKKLKTPYAIYEYVLKNLNYDFSRVQTTSPRLGAMGALNNPNSAVCLEFTDLFIAIARAAGIPAREVDGYGYSANAKERPLSLVKDILHAWPEYYDFDRNSWIMIDPTWGNTTGGVDYFNTLDFDHFAFVIKGKSSIYPIAAGGYKLSSDINVKDVNVQIGNSFANKKNTELEFFINDTLIAGLPSKASVKVSNLGSTIIEGQKVNITTNYLNPRNKTFTIDPIPPFGHESIPLNFENTPFLTNKSDTVKITIGNSSIYKNVKILPVFLNKLFFQGGIIIVSICIIISIIAYVFRRISFFRQRR